MTRELIGLLALLLLWSASPCSAQDRRLSSAQRALARAEYQRAQEIAQAGIESGTVEGEELGSLYQVIGVAAAHLGDEAASRAAFTRALALDPEFRLERTQPAEVRSPYMEARGFWSAQPIRLDANVEPNSEFSALAVRVSDPGNLVARIRLRARIHGSDRFVEIVQPPAPRVIIPIPGLAQAGSLDYIVGFLDEFGNRIWQRGSEEEPEHLEAAPRRSESASAPASPATRSGSPDATPFHVAGATVLALGGAALIGAGIAHAERENAAARWNATTECSGAGLTRAEACADERRTVDSTGIAAAVLYGVGGALAVAGAVLLSVAPSGPSDSPGGSSRASVRCALSLTGAICAGTF